jgi:hypothetical protein
MWWGCATAATPPSLSWRRVSTNTLDQLSALLTRYTCQDAAMVERADLEGLGEGLGEPAASCQVLDCAAAQPFRN